MDYLYTATAGQPAPEFREALRILSAPPRPTPLKFSRPCHCCKEELVGKPIGRCENRACVTNGGDVGRQFSEGGSSNADL